MKRLRYYWDIAFAVFCIVLMLVSYRDEAEEEEEY